jgi:HEAT repeat protein
VASCLPGRQGGTLPRSGRPGDVARRLADNARVDSEPGVRLENLFALAYECPGDPNTRVALHRACADRSHEIRVRAAAILGEDGRHTLIELVFAKRVEDKWAAQALTQLKGHLPPGTVKEILNRALHRRRVETARACLATLGTGGWPEGVAMLASVMAREEGELAVVAAQALGQYGIGGAEEPLVMALARDAPRLRVAAAEALGRVGSPAAVAPLKEAEARHGDDSAFRRAARQAIAEIQSRMTGASPGQLSLALSAAPGKLSLVPDEKGRLSLDQPRR